jgi:hypothetical protein
MVVCTTENWFRVPLEICPQRKPQIIRCVQKLKTANTLNQTALGTTGHKWKTADILYSRLAMECYINMQADLVHLLIRVDT